MRRKSSTLEVTQASETDMCPSNRIAFKGDKTVKAMDVDTDVPRSGR